MPISSTLRPRNNATILRLGNFLVETVIYLHHYSLVCPSARKSYNWWTPKHSLTEFFRNHENVTTNVIAIDCAKERPIFDPKVISIISALHLLAELWAKTISHSNFVWNNSTKTNNVSACLPPTLNPNWKSSTLNQSLHQDKTHLSWINQF